MTHVPSALRARLTPAPLRAALGCALAGALAALFLGEWRTLPDALAARGLRVEPGSVRWLDPPGIAPRRALVLARARGGAADVYAVTARTGGGDRVIAVADVSNLTRSREAEEEALVAAPPFAAFAARGAGEVRAVTVLDARGDPAEPARDRGARVRAAVTRWQQTGQARGYGVTRVELARPARAVALAFRGAALEITADGGAVVRVDASRGEVTDGASRARAHRRDAAAPGDWVRWTVDTVRAVPWIGPAPIAWAEGLAFSAEHVVARARLAAVGDRTQRDVAEDLADVLAGHAPRAVEGVVEGWPPAAIPPVITPALPREGEWVEVAQGEDDPFVRTNPGAPPAMYLAFVRTDRERADSRAYVAVWDPRQVEIHVAPGSEEPMGATGETGSGAIPRDERTMTRLVAGFNGAFQALHGEFGVYGEGTLLLPAKPYAATVMLLADGNTAFGTWPRALRDIPDEVVEFRQNLTPLVDGGVYNPWRRQFWGGVFGNTSDPHTARSGICLTREGFVAYFWGVLTPETLGRAMVASRCTYGMHLDMNGSNTGFELYRVGRASALPRLGRPLVAGAEAEGTIGGMPGVTFRARKLVRRMTELLPRYIRRDPRDFFYLLLRAVLPGPPLRAPVEPAQPGEGRFRVAGLGEHAFPWPMARTRVRPDPARPERWVNVVRVDPRRVALAPADARERVVARFVNAQRAGAGELRVSMSTGAAGPRWVIGTEGDGVAGEALGAGMSVVRGAGIDADGYLVVVVADRAAQDLVARALDLAGCGPARIALGSAALALPNGLGAAGEALADGAAPALALVARDAPLARRMFEDVTPVSPNVWQPVQARQVRYVWGEQGSNTYQVRVLGQQPVVLPTPPSRPRGAAAPDAGAR